MLGAHEVGNVSHVAQVCFGRIVVVAEEDPDPADVDHATSGRTGTNLLVGNVARMVVNHPWIGVREDHRLLHVFRCLANGALAGVSATHDHADPLHLVEYAPTLRREEIGRASSGERGCQYV